MATAPRPPSARPSPQRPPHDYHQPSVQKIGASTNVRQLVIGKRGDITDGAVGADEYLITLEGRPSGIFLLGDYGLKLVGHAIVASNESIQQKPDMVRRFVDATLRGYDFVKANQPEALEIFFRRNPDASRPLNENQLKERVPLFSKIG